MTSVRRWLLYGLIAGLAMATLLSGIGIFHTARSEANELFDYELRTVALSLPTDIDRAASILHGAPDFRGLSEDRLFIEIWGQDGHSVYRSLDGIDLPRFPAGFQTIERNEYHWRIFGMQQGDRFIQVAQPISVRDNLALRLALRTLWPLGLFIPTIIIIVLFVVRRGLQPLSGISRALQTRSLDSLEPLRLEGSVPIELQPLVLALNDLLKRLDTASQAQRIFIADAAHELRSPLAALKLQLQAAGRDASLASGKQTLTRIEDRLNRVIHLVNQVLTLAREDVEDESVFVPVNLRKLCERIVADHVPLAEAKRIDLGLDCEPADGGAWMIKANPRSIEILLANLIDNAIRYTQEGGKVDVTLWHDPRGLNVSVSDNGPGIALQERVRVFDRFYRIAGTRESGSGLGLAIAQEIARHHHTTLDIDESPLGGLRMTLAGLAEVA